MYNLRNLTNSPYVITLAEGGTKVLPARGELKDVEVHYMHVQQIKNCGYIEISDSGKSSDTESSSEGGGLEKLREEYTDLTGEEPDLRWGKKRLESEIEQAFNGK